MTSATTEVTKPSKDSNRLTPSHCVGPTADSLYHSFRQKSTRNPRSGKPNLTALLLTKPLRVRMISLTGVLTPVRLISRGHLPARRPCPNPKFYERNRCFPWKTSKRFSNARTSSSPSAATASTPWGRWPRVSSAPCSSWLDLGHLVHVS